MHTKGKHITNNLFKTVYSHIIMLRALMVTDNNIQKLLNATILDVE